MDKESLKFSRQSNVDVKKVDWLLVVLINNNVSRVIQHKKCGF